VRSSTCWPTAAERRAGQGRPRRGQLTHARRSYDPRSGGTAQQRLRGSPVGVSSPQGKFSGGAALLDGLTLVNASAWGKHLFAEFEGERWLNVHLGLIGAFPVCPDW